MINLEDSNILNVYRFGSIVYKTYNVKSDEDYIVVTKEKVISPNVNFTFFTVKEFELSLQTHDIQILECLNLPKHHILKEEFPFNYIIDKSKLRVSISTISSNSWIKGKKKLTVLGDYDSYLATKSIFHSLRILDYGTQLALYSRIQDFTSMNWVWEDLVKLSNSYSYVELWEKIEAKYKKIFNEKSSKFKSLCPKVLVEDNKLKQDLIKLFESNNCYNSQVVNSNLITKIINLINKL